MLYDALYIAKLRFRYGQSEQRAGDIRAFVSRVEVKVLGHESAFAREAEKFRVVFIRAYRHVGVFPEPYSFYSSRDLIRIVGEHNIDGAVFSVHSAYSPL